MASFAVGYDNCNTIEVFRQYRQPIITENLDLRVEAGEGGGSCSTSPPPARLGTPLLPQLVPTWQALPRWRQKSL